MGVNFDARDAIAAIVKHNVTVEFLSDTAHPSVARVEAKEDLAHFFSRGFLDRRRQQSRPNPEIAKRFVDSKDRFGGEIVAAQRPELAKAANIAVDLADKNSRA